MKKLHYQFDSEGYRFTHNFSLFPKTNNANSPLIFKCVGYIYMVE